MNSSNLMCLSNGLRTVLMLSLLPISLSFTSIANAAQGCGFGYHRAIYNGACVLNHPGPYRTPAPAHSGCWRNAWGALRCYR